MTRTDFDQLPALLRARQVRETGIPAGVLQAISELVIKADQEIPFGKIGYIVLRSTRAGCTGVSRRLYLKGHIARFLGKEFNAPN